MNCAGLDDGLYHAVNCPSPEHRGDGDSKGLHVRKNTDDSWTLKCWTHGCSYKSIADALGIAVDKRTGYKNDPTRHRIATYIGGDGAEFHAFRRDFPRDFPETPSVCGYRKNGTQCGERGAHKHIWTSRGAKVKESKPLLWGVDAPEKAILLVEGEKPAAALARTFANNPELDAVWIPATSANGAQSAKVIDWTPFADREVAIWQDLDDAGADYLRDASAGIAAVGVKALYDFDLSLVDASGKSGADAADLSVKGIERVLSTKRALVAAPAKAKASKKAGGAAADDGSLEARIKPSGDNATTRTLGVRLIARHGANMIIGDTSQRGGERYDAVLYKALDNGRLESLRPTEQALMRDVQRGYLSDLVESIDDISSGEFGIVKSHQRGITDDRTLDRVRGEIVASAREFDDNGWDTPDGFGVVKAELIDDNCQFLGFPNGVVDLRTGELLSPADARRTLTSLSVKDDYDPTAKTDDVDKMTAHLTADERRWLWSAFGAAMWGSPNGHSYWLIGEGAGGKSTVLETVANALGDYGSALPEGALAKGRGAGASPDLQQMTLGARFMQASEFNLSDMSVQKFKTLAGGDMQNTRALFKGFLNPKARVKATMVFSLNPKDLTYIPMDDSGFARRFRAIRYPKPPAIDDGLRDRLLSDKRNRQAIIAKIVRAARDNRYHPADCPSVAAYRDELRQDNIGGSGRWIERHIVADGGENATGGNHRLTSDEIWNEAETDAMAESDFDSKDKKAWGVTRNSLMGKVKLAFGLPAMKPMRGADGKSGKKGWYGIRWRTDDELAAYDAEREGRTPVKSCKPSDWIAGVACPIHNRALVDGACVDPGDDPKPPSGGGTRYSKNGATAFGAEAYANMDANNAAADANHPPESKPDWTAREGAGNLPIADACANCGRVGALNAMGLCEYDRAGCVRDTTEWDDGLDYRNIPTWQGIWGSPTAAAARTRCEEMVERGEMRTRKDASGFAPLYALTEPPKPPNPEPPKRETNPPKPPTDGVANGTLDLGESLLDGAIAYAMPPKPVAGERLALDLETTGLSPITDDIVAVLVHAGGTTYINRPTDAMADWLRDALTTDGAELVTQNGYAFDMPFIQRWLDGVRVSARLVDTTVLASVLTPKAKTALEALVERWLGVRIEKDRTLTKSGFVWEAGAERMRRDQERYCHDDVQYLVRLAERLEYAVDAHGLTRIANMEAAIQPSITALHSALLPLDGDGIERELVDAQSVSTGALAALRAQGLDNPNAGGAVKDWLAERGITVADARKATLADIPAAKPILAYRNADKRVKTLAALRTAQEREGGFRGAYRQAGAVTGRFTGRGVNLGAGSQQPQNIPRDLRYLFASESGWLAIADLSGVELRIHAALNDSEMAQAFRDGRDLHSETQERGNLPDRTLAKNYNFGLIFGGGLNGLHRAGIADATQAGIAAWRRAWRKSAATIDAARAIADAGGESAVEGAFGYKRALSGDELTAPNLLNTPVQSAAAFGLKTALYELQRRGRESELMLVLHDEIMLGVYDSEADAQAAEADLRAALISGVEKALASMNPPNAVPIEVESVIAQAWDKP